ncbi:vinorine synthase-like [Camellia sinensis]|uniref:vinorine synthase-like n=1 Tax=Camellia sinensis TaxID=4442 RepID=UPI001036DAC2|nr:vinorine synthase-like [Camellia sinensis]
MVNMDVFDVEIVSSETIKPSSPTPSHLKNFNLSLLDQITPPFYIPTTIFYSPTINANQILQNLKDSLAEALSIFYPLAGRIKGHLSIDCNDEGVLFSQAKVNCQLSEFLNPPDTNNLVFRLLPIVEIPIPIERLNDAAQMVIQVNIFTCGGICIGLYFLHQIIDATALMTFISCWAAIASRPLGKESDSCSPNINAASLFPPRSDSQLPPPEKLVSYMFNQKWLHKKECGVSTRFVIDGAAISLLKAKVASKAVPNPTRFQVVASFIWNCAVSASTSFLGSQKPSVMYFAVNMKPKMVPPMSQNSIGNIVWYAVVHHREEEATELRSMVELLSGAVQKINVDHILSLQGDQRFAVMSGVIDELRNMYSDETPDLYTCAPWCGLGFYDVDFGWGKPLWIVSPVRDGNGLVYSIVIFLMDTKSGDGVEVILVLPQSQMDKLLCDQDFITLFSINPSISVPLPPLNN